MAAEIMSSMSMSISKSISKSGEIWFEKYRPKCLDDLIISNTKKEQIREWFQSFKNGTSDEYAILLIGPPGLGKTTLAHIILKEFNYHVKEFNASDIRSKALIDENLSGLINRPNNCFVARRLNYKGGTDIPVNGIIMDEVDGMFKGDRGGMDALMTYITPSSAKPHSRKVPIICICNIGNVKKDTINSLKKECFTIEFTLAENSALIKVFDRITMEEQMDVEEEAKLSIIEYAQGDFRRLVNILEFINLMHGKIFVTQEHLDLCYDILCRKDQDLYITDSIRDLINKRMDPYKIQTIYNGDKSKTPMVVHQNYLRSISVMKTTALNKISLALIVVNSLITSDVIEKLMYNTQNWGLQPIQSYTCAHIPNFYMNLTSKSAYIDAKWASVLSINSQAQNLKKNMYIELHKMSFHKTYNIADLQQIVEMIFIMLINGNIESAIDMLYKYKLCMDDENINVVSNDFTKKKALVAIDKLAKYIKISPYYEEWNTFKNKHKSNKALDTQIKEYIQSKINEDVVLVPLKKGIKKLKTKIAEPELEEPMPLPQPKTVEEQKSLVQVRKVVIIKKKV